MSVSISAVIPGISNCRFSTPSTTMNFGLLDPANPGNVTVGISIGFRCNGGSRNVVFAMASDDGRFEAGPGSPRMRHNVLTNEFLPYSLTLSPVSGIVQRNTNQLLAVTGTILGVSYENATAGGYSDIVTLSILP